ncbi:MAG: methyltransferase domain-containing protein [Bdellovibrionales bacterium]|jgi:SAM-dependent methyltransferase
MGNPIASLIENPVLQARLLRVRIAALGLARDYWKDPKPRGKAQGGLFSFLDKKGLFSRKASTPAKPVSRTADIADFVVPPAQDGMAGAETTEEIRDWMADRIQVMEVMWGAGSSFPGGAAYIDALASPLGLNDEASVLDLGAGLGDMARKLAEDYKCYVTGLEANQTLAQRGMIMSIAAAKSKKAPVTFYDPAEYSATRKYDCIIAREVFCRVVGKEKFFKAVDASLKNGGGQIVFTDFVLNPSMREKPAIVKWLEREKAMAPLTQLELIKTWKGMGYDLRIAEDQTALYKNNILAGLVDLVPYMRTNVPDVDTKRTVVREVDFWSRRLAALGHGLKYYRFYGIKY